MLQIPGGACSALRPAVNHTSEKLPCQSGSSLTQVSPSPGSLLESHWSSLKAPQPVAHTVVLREMLRAQGLHTLKPLEHGSVFGLVLDAGHASLIYEVWMC